MSKEDDIRWSLPSLSNGPPIVSGLDSEDWLQLNIDPCRGREDEVLEPLVRYYLDGREDGRVSHFFFMRKPPGLRVRYRIPRQNAVFEELQRALDGQERSGLLTKWAASVYEPEARLFGGEQAIESVHEYFTADSVAWHTWKTTRLELAVPVLLVAVANDLLGAVLDGAPEETWDVWCRVSELHGIEARSKEAGMPPDAVTRAGGDLTTAAVTFLRSYRKANRTLAAHLARIRSDGNLKCGIRALLGWLILFQWNRYALPAKERRAICEAMTHHWDPNGRRH